LSNNNSFESTINKGKKLVEEVNQEIHEVKAFTENVPEPEQLVNQCCMEKNEPEIIHARPLADEASILNSRESTKSNETNLTSDGADFSNATENVDNKHVEVDEPKKNIDSNILKTNNPSTFSEHHSMLEFAMMHFKQSIEKLARPAYFY
jgi:hypothetical protein